jgi:hypothetical protein
MPTSPSGRVAPRGETTPWRAVAAVSPAPARVPAPVDDHVDEGWAPPPVRRPRRRGGVLRFFQMVLSLAVLVSVPVLAAVLAYGYGNGDSWQVDIRNLWRDLLPMIGIN